MDVPQNRKLDASGVASPAAVPGSSGAPGRDPGAVLVHGAYADGSSWSEVIERLQRAGVAATAVQNPLTSLTDDVAHTRRILALQDGPVILAGHSFAGTVITEAGTHPNVVGLVYIAARAPDAGEDYAALTPEVPGTTCQRRACLHRRVRGPHRGRVPQRFRQRRGPRPGARAVRGARTRLGITVPRKDHGGGLAVKAILVCHLAARSHHLTRA